MIMVKQRFEFDCGCAAVASLCQVTYEQAAEAWERALSRKPHASNYKHLLAVIAQLGMQGYRVSSGDRCIRFVREKPRLRTGHWVVVVGESLWCPTAGWFQLKADYPWKFFGRGIAIK